MLLATILILTSTTGPDRLDFQLMTSPAYSAFAAKGEAICPARRLRYLHPADLDGIEEDFWPSLSKREQRQVTARQHGDGKCPPAGASCPAQHLLTAIMRAGRLDDFTHFACASAI